MVINEEWTSGMQQSDHKWIEVNIKQEGMLKWEVDKKKLNGISKRIPVGGIYNSSRD